MTKKEKAAHEKIVNDLKLRAALRWTEPVAPDVPPPTSYCDALTSGYLPLAALRGRVEMACSSSVHHGTGSKTRTTSQGPVSLYSTRLLALRALRHKAELEAADALRSIDYWIEQEMIGRGMLPEKLE